MLEASLVSARHQAFRAIRWWASLCRFTAQHAPSAHGKTIISVLMNIQDDKPKEREEPPVPSLFDSGILHLEVGADIEIKPKASPLMTRMTRRTTRLAAYFFPVQIPEVYEPPSDDESGLEGSSPWPPPSTHPPPVAVPRTTPKNHGPSSPSSGGDGSN